MYVTNQFGQSQNQANQLADNQAGKRQYQNSKGEFSLGWEVPQVGKRGDKQITGKVGFGQQEQDQGQQYQDDYEQQYQNQLAYQQQQQGYPQQGYPSQQGQLPQQYNQQGVAQHNYNAHKENSLKNKKSDIFNSEPSQQSYPEAKQGYGEFYQKDRKALRKDEEEGNGSMKGYGNFYTKNQQGQYDNIPRPAQSMKQQSHMQQ